MASQYPTGSIISIGNTYLSTVPPGFLLCDGRAVSRSLYFRLFQVIGTTYGAGDGSTSFNLPNLQKQFAKGVSVSVMQQTAGTSPPPKTSFLGATFSYDLGINVSQSTYTNPTGISTTNLIPFSSQSSVAGEHTHNYYFNLENADFGAGCKNDSKDNFNPPNRNAQQRRIYDDDNNRFVNYEWYKYHHTGGRDVSDPNNHGHARSAGQFTHTCKEPFVQQNSQTKCNPAGTNDTQTAPNDIIGNRLCTRSQIKIGQVEGGQGKSIPGHHYGDHKHVVIGYYQFQQGNRISIDDPGSSQKGPWVGEDCFDPLWVSKRITNINGEHNHGGSLSIVGQTGIEHNLLTNHNFQVTNVEAFISVAPGYEGAGTKNATGNTAPAAIALGWGIKY